MNPHLSQGALAAALFLAGLALLGVFLALPLPTFLGRILADDAFYYLVPARHFLQGLGTTFDGVALTNGYHPLWMLVVIAGVWLTPESLHLYLLPAMSGVFYLLGALGLSFLLFPQRSAFEKAVLFSIFCFNFLAFRVHLQGLENGLNFFILAALLIYLQNHFTSPRKFWILGCLLALLALSRVDHVLFAFFVLGLLCVLRRKAPGRLVREGLAAGLPVLALFGSYLCMNQLVFGSFLPVSGMAKEFYETVHLRDGWPHGGFWGNIAVHFKYVLELALYSLAGFSDRLFLWLFNAPLPFPNWILGGGLLAVYAISAIGLVFSCCKVWKRELSPYYLAFVAFAGFHLLLYAIRLPHFAQSSWYFTFEYLVLLLSFFFGLEACCRFVKWRRPLCPAFATAFCLYALALVFVLASHAKDEETRVNRFRQAALWINQNLPEGVAIGALSAGILGHFVENRRVVNLDGLINSVEYLDILRQGQFVDHFLAKLDYYADYHTNESMEKAGVCWLGSCVPPSRLQLIKKWQISETETYWIFKVLP